MSSPTPEQMEATAPPPRSALCGGHRCRAKRVSKFRAVPPSLVGQYITTQVHSAYLGEVSLSCLDLGRGNIGLISPVRTLNGRDTLYVKEIDCQLNRLNPESIDYPLRKLIQLPPTVINLAQCAQNAAIVASLRAKATPLTPGEQEQLSNALAYNAPVDCHFNTCKYLEFLQQRLKINSPVPQTNHVITLHGLPGLDNAFFTGNYMVVGSGAQMFYPLATADIIGHEDSHAIVQQLSGLVYRGHAGALNESFADVLGVCYEFYLYAVTKGLTGVADWTVGEDNGRTVKFLRNLQDPSKAEMPQPKTYRGALWRNPNEAADYGHVHTNSGPANFAFYDFSQRLGGDAMKALDVWIACLRQLQPNASYIDFRDTLKRVCPVDLVPLLQLSLEAAGLSASAVSDWTSQPPGTKRK